MDRCDQSSPTKRQRLSFSRQKSRRFTEALDEQDLQDLRDESIAKLQRVWNHIERRYALDVEDPSDEEIDLDKLDEEAIRHKYFREPASTAQASLDEQSFSSDDSREDSNADSSSEDEVTHRHYTYFQRARRRYNTFTTAEQSQKVTHLDLSDSESNSETTTEFERAATPSSPRILSTASERSTVSDSEADDVQNVEVDRWTPIPEVTTCKPPSTPIRRTDPKHVFTHLQQQVPTFSPAPSSPFRSSLSPEPRLLRQEQLHSSHSHSVHPEITSRLHEESSDSEWDDNPLATPTRTAPGYVTPFQSPTRIAAAGARSPPSTCQRLPLSALHFTSSSPSSSHTRPSTPQLTASSPFKTMKTLPVMFSEASKDPIGASPGKQLNSPSPYISLEALSRPTPSKSQQKETIDICTSSSQSGDESGSQCEKVQDKALTESTVSSDAESERELARWG